MLNQEGVGIALEHKIEHDRQSKRTKNQNFFKKPSKKMNDQGRNWSSSLVRKGLNVRLLKLVGRGEATEEEMIDVYIIINGVEKVDRKKLFSFFHNNRT